MLPPPFTESTALPTVQQAHALWDRFHMLDNIRQHSRVVCDVALILTDWLEQAGVPLHRKTVQAGALLHDIAKTQCLGTRRRHDLEGAKILNDLGYPELAYLVAVHVNLPEPHPVDESFIVYYADKRVNHDRVVDLDHRFAYIAERYGRGDATLLARIQQGQVRAKAAERQLFASLDPSHSPEDIGAWLFS